MNTSVANPDSTFRYCGSDFFFKSCQLLISVYQSFNFLLPIYIIHTTWYRCRRISETINSLIKDYNFFVKRQHIFSLGSSSRDQDNCKRKLHEKEYDEIKLNKFFFWKLMGHNLMIIIVLFVHFLYDQFHAHRCTFWTRERKQY